MTTSTRSTRTAETIGPARAAAAMLYAVATVVTLVALSSPYVARSRGYAVSAVTGAATGAALLVAARFSLVPAVS
jgi:hypothetical protein